MAFVAHVEPLKGDLPAASYRWDPETEILSGRFDGTEATGGLTGSVELEGADGSFIILDIAAGSVRGLEVVVWPEIAVVAGLKAPKVTERGRMTMPPRQSQPNIAAVEVETTLSVRKSSDDATMHLRVGKPRAAKPVALADNVILETDAKGHIAGFWLLHVPPFPAERAE